jgi:hypothetical protein
MCHQRCERYRVEKHGPILVFWNRIREMSLNVKIRTFCMIMVLYMNCVFQIFQNKSKFVNVVYIHTYIHTHIPWIHKFVMATRGCGIIHKDIKHTDRCSNNKNKNNTEIIRRNYRQIVFQNTVKITQKKFDIYIQILYTVHATNDRQNNFCTCYESF